MPRIDHSQRTTCPRCRSIFQHRLDACPYDGSPLKPLPQDPLVGDTLVGRYQIHNVHRDGRLARTYVGEHIDTGERVLVRVMYSDYVVSRRARARFARETFIGRDLHHPNVLAVLDSGETSSGLPFLVTRHRRGELLSHVIRCAAPLDGLRIRRLLQGIARGLDHIHQSGVILRGLSSDSILITQDAESERAMITSFAFASAGREPSDNKVTQLQNLVGRASYMSPEQVSSRLVDKRTDYYSVGVILYEMLCGKVPFDGSPVAVAMRHSFEEPQRLGQRIPGLVVDADLEAIALRLLRKNPERRYQSKDALLQALARQAAAAE